MTLIESPPINELIYTLRGQQVKLDTDLAMLYGFGVKRLNGQVNRMKY